MGCGGRGGRDPCAFGCAQKPSNGNMGPRDYGCGCPRGYRRLEGGHCLAINSISSYNRFGGGGGAPMEELDYTSGRVNVWQLEML